MENKKGVSFFFTIVALIVGKALYNQFDFETFKFEKPAIAVLYIITLASSTYLLVKNYRKPPEE